MGIFSANARRMVVGVEGEEGEVGMIGIPGTAHARATVVAVVAAPGRARPRAAGLRPHRPGLAHRLVVAVAPPPVVGVAALRPAAADLPPAVAVGVGRHRVVGVEAALRRGVVAARRRRVGAWGVAIALLHGVALRRPSIADNE
jgi:hypothetical protein